jgi:hypothetical protein
MDVLDVEGDLHQIVLWGCSQGTDRSRHQRIAE